jgi:hypothetical protein
MTDECVHDWSDVETYCEDCGTHPAIYCEECGTLIDLVMNEDPRDLPVPYPGNRQPGMG